MKSIASENFFWLCIDSKTQPSDIGIPPLSRQSCLLGKRIFNLLLGNLTYVPATKGELWSTAVSPQLLFRQ